MDFSEMCRLCLCVEATTMLMCLNDGPENLVDKIQTISKIKINAEDGLPSQICQECINLVNICYNFKLQVERSDMILKHHISVIQETGHRQDCNGEEQKVLDVPHNVTDVKPSRENVGENMASDTSKNEEVIVKEESSRPADPSPNKQPAVVKILENGSESSSEKNINSTYPAINDEEDPSSVPLSACGGDTNSEVRSKSENKIAKTISSTNVTHQLVSRIYMQSSLYRKDSNTNKKTIENSRSRECKICGKFVQNISLHMRVHTGEKPYQCSVCGQRFIQRGGLIKHHTAHTGERPHKCTLCGKSFRCKSDLSQHKKLHTEDFKCSICEKVCTNRQSLEMHVRVHTGEKPYLCHTCGLHFSQKGGLNKHAMVHENERPFPCSICKKNFITQSSLTKHFRTHTGEKPYTCATCEKSFTDRGYFMRHLQIHSGEKTHVCSVCGKGFTQQISLKRHVRLHTGEKPFECATCRECFVLKRDLKRHTERLHTK